MFFFIKCLITLALVAGGTIAWQFERRKMAAICAVVLVLLMFSC